MKTISIAYRSAHAVTILSFPRSIHGSIFAQGQDRRWLWSVVGGLPLRVLCEGRLDFEFTSAEWTELSKQERIEKCLLLAAVADKADHNAIARQWRQLAADIEAAN
jgi:hypothetical protein